MSDEEKQLQIAAAVTAYQAAKIECAHIDKKIGQICQVFRQVGDSMLRGGTEPKLVDGKLHFSYDRGEFAASLMNEAEFTALIVVRDAARKRLSDAKQMMESLGLGNLS
jgi:UDP-N-acetylglucosamine enolpyruvyl transferase